MALPDGSFSGARRQPGAFRTVMAMLSMYADHETGANARPSLRLLQDMSHYKHNTVREALNTAKAAGYIAAVDTWTPPNGGDPITVWALGYPTPEGFRPWHHEPSARSSPGTTADDSVEWSHRTDKPSDTAKRNATGPVGRDFGESAERATTPLTSRPLGSEEERESESAAPPDGGTRPRLAVVEVKQVVQEIVPTVAFGTGGGIKCDNPDLTKALELVLDRGWTLDTLRQQLADMPPPKKSPTGLLIRRIQSLVDTDPEAMALPPVHNPETSTADPLAGVDQKALTRFCENASANEKELRASLVQLASEGFTITADLSPDGEYDMPTVRVGHPELFDTWRVQWSAQKSGAEAYSFVSARIRDASLVEEHDRQRLQTLGDTEMNRNTCFITAPIADLAALLRLVRETWPIAEKFIP